MYKVKNSIVVAFLLWTGLHLCIEPLSAKPPLRTERGALTYNIVMKWSGVVQRRPGSDIRRWSEQMTPLFKNVPMKNLRNAASARTFEEMNDALLGNPIANTTIAPKYLGELTRDYVFTPVVPCRIADTRFNTPLVGGQARTFMGTDSSFASAGGSASNCGLPESPAVLVLNVTAVEPLGAGFLTVYPANEQRPTASSLNYAAGQIVGNQTMVQATTFGSYVAFNIHSFATTHVVVDVLGYFDEVKLISQKLDCVGTFATTSIDGNALAAPATLVCPQGYAMVSVNCLSGSLGYNDWGLQVVSQFIFENVEQAQCQVRNNSGVSRSFQSSGRCCRTWTH